MERRHITPEQQDKYEQILLRRLDDRPVEERLFFVNEGRFDLMHQLAGKELFAPTNKKRRLLNVASGPFAFEVYHQDHTFDITSIDIDEKCQAVYDDLQQEKLISGVNFILADAKAYQPEGLFDVVLINDLFYWKFVNFYELFAKYASHVAPDGLLYFDICDKRAETIWKLFGKNDQFVRYDFSEIESHMKKAGFKIVAQAPSMGIKGGVDKLIRTCMWHGLGIANNTAFVVKRAD